MSGDKLLPSFNILKSSHTKSGGQLGTLAVTAGVMASSVLGTNLKSNSLEKKILDIGNNKGNHKNNINFIITVILF